MLCFFLLRRQIPNLFRFIKTKSTWTQIQPRPLTLICQTYGILQYLVPNTEGQFFLSGLKMLWGKSYPWIRFIIEKWTPRTQIKHHMRRIWDVWRGVVVLKWKKSILSSKMMIKKQSTYNCNNRLWSFALCQCLQLK